MQLKIFMTYVIKYLLLVMGVGMHGLSLSDAIMIAASTKAIVEIEYRNIDVAAID